MADKRPFSGESVLKVFRFSIIQTFLALAVVSGVAAQDVAPVVPPVHGTFNPSIAPSPIECCEKASRDAWDEGDTGSAIRFRWMAFQLGFQKMVDDHLAAFDRWLFGYAKEGQKPNWNLENHRTVPKAPKSSLAVRGSALPTSFLFPKAMPFNESTSSPNLGSRKRHAGVVEVAAITPMSAQIGFARIGYSSRF